MDFSLSDEQLQIRDAVRRFCDREYPAAARGIPADAAASERRWKLMAELGLLGLPFDARHGGSGQSAVELMLVMEEFGRCLGSDPYLPTVILGGSLVAAAGSAGHADALLPDVIAGKRQLTLAISEPQARYDLGDVGMQASESQGSYVLDGRKTLVLEGDTAATLLVAARTRNSARDADGITLFVVERSTPGVSVRGYPTLDGRRAADIEFKDVRVGAAAVLGPIDGAYALIEDAVDRANAALCADAVGAIDALIALNAEHLKTRKQFGVPLAKFQVLQHRQVDMQIGLEQAKSMASAAAMAVDGADAAERRRLVSAAKVRIAQIGRFVGQAAVQMHGAMGMTDECKVGRYAKRLLVMGQLFGDVRYHLRRFAA